VSQKKRFFSSTSSAVTIIFITLGLSACSSIPGIPGTVPNFDNPQSELPSLTVSKIIDEINCELYNVRDTKAARPRAPNVEPFSKWVAAVSLTLQVDDSIGLSPTLTYTDPVKFLGFSFGGTATLSGSRQRVYTQDYTVTIANLNVSSCEKLRYRNFDLEGDLGISDIVRMGMRSFDANDPAEGYGGQAASDPVTTDNSNTSKTQEAFGATIQFVVTKGLSALGPTWTINIFKGPGGLFNVSRSDTHKVIISFAPPAPPSGTANPGASGQGSKLLSGVTAGQINAAQNHNQLMLLQSIIPHP